MESQEPVLWVDGVGASTASGVGNQVAYGRGSVCTGGEKPTLLKQDDAGESSIVQIPKVHR